MPQQYDSLSDELWLYGAGPGERRPLTDDERTQVSARAAGVHRERSIWRIAAGGAVALLCAGLAVWLFAVHDETHALGQRITIYLLLAPLALIALSGAVSEIVVGWSQALRIFFSLAGISVGAALLIDRPAMTPIYGLGGLLILAVGTVCVGVRFREYRRRLRMLDAIRIDLDRGRVVVFDGTPFAEANAQALKRLGLCRELAAQHSFAMLERSGMLIAIKRSPTDPWQAHDGALIRLAVARTASSSAGGMTIPIPNLSRFQGDHEVLQRHMTSAEVVEIERHRRFILRRGCGTFCLVAYLAVTAGRFGAKLLHISPSAALTPAGLALAACVGLYFAVGWLRLYRRLTEALALRKVVVLRKLSSDDADADEQEILAGTDILWKQHAGPAQWRKHAKDTLS